MAERHAAQILPGSNVCHVASRRPGWRWGQIGTYAALHLGCVLAPFYVSTSAIVMTFVLFVVCAGLGVSCGWHRLLTHKSFKCPAWLRYTFVLLGCCSWQGGPIEWAGTHRRHHSHSDDEGADPHTPREGFFWAHAGWMFYNLPYDPLRYTRDLTRESVLVAIDKYYWVWPWGLLVALYAAGEWLFASGMSWLVWAGFVRSAVILHVTWFVNSAAHTWGYRNFATHDDSRNNPAVAYLSFGEGWHNNHHAQPRSAAHGMCRGEFDATYVFIKLLERIGLAWEVIEPGLEKQDERQVS